jgi:very-short-patch-repair endonuclease
MQPLPRPLIALARGQHGLLTKDQLAAISRRQRSLAIGSGQLTIVHRDVYRLASHPETFEQRCLAACFAAPDAVLSGPTAGRIHNVRRVRTDDVHILARRAIELDGVSAHRTTLLGPADVQMVGPLRVLRPARLACDLAAYVDDAVLESAIEQMLDRGQFTMSTLRSLARQFCTSGRNGSVRLARVLDGRPNWRRPVDSDIELRLLHELESRGLDVVTQVPVLLDSGRTIHLDLAVPDVGLGIEVDHVTWHGGRLDAQRDKARDRELMRLGWTVVRATDEDIERRLISVADDVVAIAERLRVARHSRKAG